MRTSDVGRRVDPPSDEHRAETVRDNPDQPVGWGERYDFLRGRRCTDGQARLMSPTRPLDATALGVGNELRVSACLAVRPGHSAHRRL